MPKVMPKPYIISCYPPYILQCSTITLTCNYKYLWKKKQLENADAKEQEKDESSYHLPLPYVSETRSKVG